MTDFNIVVKVDTKGAVEGGRKVKTAFRDVESQSDRLRKSIQRTFAFIGTAAAVRAIINLADSFTNLQNRLRLVTKGEQQLAETTNELFKISQRTRSSFAGTAEIYSRVALSAKDLGVESKQLLQFTASLNKAVLLSGAGAQEARNGLIQLSQGLASGALRGDELRSVLEQLPLVADVIAKELNITRGALRELGAEGKISADIVLEAFKNAREELDERFAKTVPTVEQAMTQLGNAFQIFIGRVDQSTGVSTAIARVFQFLANNIEVLTKLVVGLATAILVNLVRKAIPAAIAGIAGLTGGLRGLAVLIKTNIFGLLIGALVTVVSLFVDFEDEIEDATKDVMGLADAFGAVAGQLEGLPELYGDAFGGDAVAKAIRGGAKLVKEQQRQASVIEEATNKLKAQIKLNTMAEGQRGRASALLDIENRKKVALTKTEEVRLGILLDTIKLQEGREKLDKQVASIEQQTAALRMSVRTREVVAAQLKAETALKRALLPVEKDRVANAVRALQAEKERAAFRGLRDSLQQEIKLLLLSDQEREHRLFLMNAEKQIGDKLNATQSMVLSTIYSITTALKERNAAQRALIELQQKQDQQLESIIADMQREVEVNKALAQGETVRAELLRIQAQVGRELNVVDQARLALLIGMNDAYLTQAEVLEAVNDPLMQYRNTLAQIEKEEAAGIITIAQANQKIAEAEAIYARLAPTIDKARTATQGFNDGLRLIQDDIQDVGSVVEQSLVNAFGAAEDALVNFVTTGKLNFKQLANSIIADIARILIRQALLAGLGGLGIPGFQTGGQFKVPSFQTGGQFGVGGRGGPDSQLVAFRASPGERVTVETPQQQQRNDVEGQQPFSPNITMVVVEDQAQLDALLNSPRSDNSFVAAFQRNQGSIVPLMQNGS